ncbi:dephospho-CoA kinase, partial [Micromonospora zamorensis]
RIAAQADDARRRAAADVVLTNDGSLADLHDAVDDLWRQRLLPYEDNLRERRVVLPGRVDPAGTDASWPEQYERLAARIRHTLGSDALRIDHIGSTALPGLAAQDVIDVQVAVRSLADADGALVDRLAHAGFPRVPGHWWDDPRPAGSGRWEKRLHGSADPARPVRLHVRVADSPGWRYALLMRDHLRADPDQRAAYLLLKRDLVDAAPEAGDSGTARDPWFDEEYLRAEQWAEQTGWRP